MNATNYTSRIVGNDRHLLSAGMAYTSGRFALNLGYNFGVHPDLMITHNAWRHSTVGTNSIAKYSALGAEGVFEGP